ncbi:YCF48-related protein [Niabella sp. CC-SYL272]|uniref:WD40/YVTN/BNR-like repeat-containing protein n=1 Tax=Niabella agricola TaxID=2891571 RepID=UPI001F168E7E|nr:YCF48-related protein [Niabella agricola]MCF3107842.1 YCF48-related protein [Niabella agricola]
MFRNLLLFFLCTGSFASASQNLEIISTGNGTNLRGIGGFKNTIWVSGSNGYTGRSADGGQTWQWQQVPGFENRDFRDIAVLDENTAILMGIASPAYILKTTDSGHSWKTVYENRDTAMFLDAMTFTGRKMGYVIGDPVRGNIFIARTTNAGNNWEQLPGPAALPGEAFFAASGSNLVVSGKKIRMVSGGTASRLFDDRNVTVLPLLQGTASAGANSIAVLDSRMMIAGGDFQHPDRRDSVLLLSTDGGKTFRLPQHGPGGYRSAVAPLNQLTWITCGLNGVDVTTDGGLNWKPVSDKPFNTIFINAATKTVYLAGPKGTVGQILF